MHNVKLAAKVTRADGTLFFKTGEFEWPGLDDKAVAHFKDYFARSKAAATHLHETHKDEDSQNLTAELTGSIDNVAEPAVSMTGLSYRTVTEFEKHAVDFANSLIKMAIDKAAEHHKAKHAKP